MGMVLMVLLPFLAIQSSSSRWSLLAGRRRRTFLRRRMEASSKKFSRKEKAGKTLQKTPKPRVSFFSFSLPLSLFFAELTKNITVTYTARIKGEEAVKEQKTDIEFICGDEQVIAGLDQGVQTMKKGEKA